MPHVEISHVVIGEKKIDTDYFVEFHGKDHALSLENKQR
jgi:hypothetical protein